MSFTDGKRFVVSSEDTKQGWAGGENGSRFRCNLCGHKFVSGDGCRFQYMGYETYIGHDRKKYGVPNILVCDPCDGPEVINDWINTIMEFNSDRFWSLR